jgi:hypothetical protein
MTEKPKPMIKISVETISLGCSEWIDRVAACIATERVAGWITPGVHLRQRRDSDVHRTIGFGDYAQSLGVEFDVR